MRPPRLPEGASFDDLQTRLVAFVRAFGLHRPDETPCGAPVPVSEAHALAVLAQLGPLTQSQLVRHLALRKSTVSRLVDQIVARGWAQRATAAGPPPPRWPPAVATASAGCSTASPRATARPWWPRSRR